MGGGETNYKATCFCAQLPMRLVRSPSTKVLKQVKQINLDCQWWVFHLILIQGNWVDDLKALPVLFFYDSAIRDPDYKVPGEVQHQDGKQNFFF